MALSKTDHSTALVDGDSVGVVPAQSKLGALDVPVRELAPEEVVYGPQAGRQIVRLEVARDFVGDRGRTAENPPVGKPETEREVCG